MPCTEQSSTAVPSLLPPTYGSPISLIAYRLHTPFAPPSATFHLAPGQRRARTAVGGPWESGLVWGPLTNTQPNVLIDPMPSYFRTSVRRQGAARRDRQSAALKELEQGEEEEEEEVEEEEEEEWMEGGSRGGFTALH